MVCPALLPPWKPTTASARSPIRSVIFPLPSSPHWAPTMTIPGIAAPSVRTVGPCGGFAAISVGARARGARCGPRSRRPQDSALLEARPGVVHELGVLAVERERDLADGAVSVLGE